MGLRRTAAGDQRRRRVLIEENLNVVGGEGEPDAQRQPAAKAATRSGNSYSDAACLAAQTPSIAVLASRPFTQVVVSLSCLVAVAGFLALYSHWQLWPAGTWQRSLSSLDVERPGSLAAWFCSLMLSASAFQGLQIYRLRRHKTDDYRGRYRVWTWFSILLLALASGVATGIHRELTAVLVGAVWGPVALEYTPRLPLALGFLWLLVAVRMSLEMRPNRWSLRLLAAATAAYLLGLVVPQIDIPPIHGTLVALASSALLMAGHVGVFIAVLSFGRHVYLDSRGLLPALDAKPRRVRRQNRSSTGAKVRLRQEVAGQARAADPSSEQAGEPPLKAPEAESESESEAEPDAKSEAESEAEPADPPSEAPLPVLRLGSRTDDAEADSADDEDPADPSSGQHLSKTERKRLKKMRRQDQFRRAA